MRSMATTLLGKNLKTLRQLKHINQEKLAKAVGVTRTRIASYETQNIEPKLVLLAKIAAYFSISIDVLVTVPVTRDNYDSLKTRYQSGTQPKVSGPLPLVQLPKLTSGVLNTFVSRYRQIEKAFEGVLALHALQQQDASIDLTSKQLVFIIRQLLHQNALLIAEINRVNSTQKTNK